MSDQNITDVCWTIVLVSLIVAVAVVRVSAHRSSNAAHHAATDNDTESED